MPEVKVNVLEESAKNLQELSEHLAQMQKNIRYLLGGNLDFENVRVKGLKADSVDVDVLSAFTANLGHIFSGIIESVEMYGSFIATSKDSFPRAEMSETDKMFKVAQTASQYAEFRANYNAAGGATVPALRFVNGSDYMDVGGIGPGGIFGIHGYDQLYLLAYGKINQFLTEFDRWSSIRNASTGKTLQQELDSLTTATTSLNNSVAALTSAINSKANSGVSTGSAGGHNHGIADGTQLMTSGGGTVTWHSASGHSHTQN